MWWKKKSCRRLPFTFKLYFFYDYTVFFLFFVSDIIAIVFVRRCFFFSCIFFICSLFIIENIAVFVRLIFVLIVVFLTIYKSIRNGMPFRFIGCSILIYYSISFCLKINGFWMNTVNSFLRGKLRKTHWN